MKIIASVILLLISTSLMSQEITGGQPIEVVNTGGISIPVYDFEGFNPILNQDDGNTYIINFWATWCKPCVEELPGFLELAKELEDNDVEFVFVSLDFRRNLEKGVATFIKEYGMENKTVMLHDPDANSWISRVDPSWSGAIPATLVFKGNQRKLLEEKLSYEELKSIINSF